MRVTRQPQGIVSINRSNPFGSRVLFATDPSNDLRDVVTSKQISPAGKLITSSDGVSRYNGSAAYMTVTDTRFDHGRSLTFIFRGWWNRQFSDDSVLLTISNTYGIRFVTYNSPSFKVFGYWGGATRDLTYPITGFHTTVIVFDTTSSLLKQYTDGTLINSMALPVWDPGPTVFPATLYFGDTVTESNSHKITLRAVLDGAVNDAGGVELSQNPWQIFTPYQKWLYTSMGSDGANYTPLIIPETGGGNPDPKDCFLSL